LIQRAQTYAQTQCVWSNRVIEWNRLLTTGTGTTKIEEREKSMNRLALYSSWSGHFEVFGAYLYMALQQQIPIDVYCPSKEHTIYYPDQPLYWCGYYREHMESLFGKESVFRLLHFYPATTYPVHNTYRKVVVITDNDSMFQNKWIPNPNHRIVFVNHVNYARDSNRVPCIHFGPFVDRNPDWPVIVPCYPMYSSIIDTTKQPRRVAVVGRDQWYDLSVIQRFPADTELWMLGREMVYESNKERYAPLTQLRWFVNKGPQEMHNLISTCTYMWVSYYQDIPGQADMICSRSITGSLPLAYSTRCIPIVSKQHQAIWKLPESRLIQYDTSTTDPIVLSTLGMKSFEEESLSYIQTMQNRMKSVLLSNSPNTIDILL